MAVGVGHGDEEHALSEVRGSDVGGEDPGSLHRVTELGEPSGHHVQRPPQESADVLDDDGARADFLDEPRELVPETGSVSVESGASGVGLGEVLTGEPAGEDCHGRKICASDSSDIGVPPHGGPVLRQHVAAERVGFDLVLDRPESGALQSQIEPSDPREQGPDR